MGPAEAIRDLAEPPLAAVGLELWDVEFGTEVLCITVERRGGVDLDGLATASAVLSPLLDQHPELAPAGRYHLEVSSPGLERTLRTPAQYQRYVGHTVAVKTTEAIAGARRLRGTLAEVGDSGIGITLEAAADGTPPVLVPFNMIQRTRTVLAWGPGPKPGRRAPSTHSSAKDAT